MFLRLNVVTHSRHLGTKANSKNQDRLKKEEMVLTQPFFEVNKI